MTRLHDISPLITARIGVWPGDVAFRYEPTLEISAGANIDLGAIHTTVHLGAHADAPSHYHAEGASIDEQDLGIYYGPCQLVQVEVGRGERIGPDHLTVEITAPRVLFRTRTYPDPDRFTTDFASLSPELIDHLAATSVRLVGIDTPSVDLFDDDRLVTHQALARHNMANLEGLILDGLEPGHFVLAAFPLRLAGADGSPVRAVLIEETS